MVKPSARRTVRGGRRACRRVPCTRPASECHRVESEARRDWVNLKLTFTSRPIDPALPGSATQGQIRKEDAKLDISAEGLVVILLVGLTAGWLAGQIVQGAGFGLFGDLTIGVTGAFLAGWLLPQFGILLGTGIVATIINATSGALLLLLAVRFAQGGWRGNWPRWKRW